MITFTRVDFLLGHLFGHTGRAALHKLPDDVLVDCIFSLLPVKSVLSVRRVNKRLYWLSHHAAIWKRLLRRLPIPLPPLPPSPRYSMGQLSGDDAERIVTGAISVETNWKQEHPKTFRSRVAHACFEVLSMAVVPGGAYMVAALSDKAQVRHYLMLYSMGHPSAPAVPIAVMKTHTKAYSIQAKFMAVRNKMGIVITYIRREVAPEHEMKSRLNPSKYGDDFEIDSPVPLVYESVTVHVPLDGLDALGDPSLVHGSEEHSSVAESLPAPFCRISLMKSRRVLSHPVLGEAQNVPFCAVVAEPNTVIFKNLDTGAHATVKCAPLDAFAGLPHRIRAIRVIPAQHQILVIREIIGRTDDGERAWSYTAEIYNIPGEHSGTQKHVAFRQLLFEGDKRIMHFHISDELPQPDASIDKSVQPTLAGWTGREPEPISIYCQMAEPDGFSHVIIWPTRLRSPGPSTWTLRLHDGTQWIAPPGPTHSFPIENLAGERCDFAPGSAAAGSVRICPGARRALMFTAPSGSLSAAPPLLKLFAFAVDDGSRPVRDGASREDLRRRKRLQKLCGPGRDAALAALDIPAEIQEKLARGVSAVAWDESIGRVWITAKHTHEIFILDFAQ